VGPFTHFLTDFKGSQGPGPTILALLVITLLVLFTACANVAGLNLANAGKRATELAVRSAMGATRRRLICQMLGESLLLAVVGALGGLGLIALLSRWFENWFASRESEFSQIPFWMALRMDGRLLLGLTGLILLASMLAGLWPALQASRRDTNELLNARAGGTFNLRTGRLQWCLVMVQVAFSLVVLTQSFVLLGFSQQLKKSQLPFDPGKVLSARLALPASVDAAVFFQALERNLAALPGAQAVALTSSDPVGGHTWQPLSLEGVDYPRPEDHPWAAGDVVSQGFFGALGLSLLEGRAFSQADGAGSLPVAVVNATFAKRLLGDNPLGRRFREGTNAWLTVVGCVPDLKYDPAAGQPEPLYYVPISQRPLPNMAILLRGASPANEWVKPLRSDVARLAPDLALYRVAPIQTLMMHQVIGYYLASLLLGACGAGSLFLASVGILGLITFSVNQRTREFGIRLALGGTWQRIVLTVLKQATRPITAGLTAGALLGWGLQRVLNHSIAGYPEVPHPVLLFLSAIAFLGFISVVAVLLPASRGARVEPMVALRYE
jgi:putative ABC transport system permease protein